MKTKRLMMCLLLSMALAVMFIPNVVFAVPEEADAPDTVTLETEAETVQPDVDLAEPDELLQTYLEKHAAELLANKGKKSAKRKAPRASRLESEADSAAYEQLADLAKTIAAGQESSAVLEMDITDLFEPLTAEELGVESLTDEDGNVTDEAEKAYTEISQIQLDPVISALLTDFPYDFYWYEKTKGIKSSMSYAVIQDNIDGTDVVRYYSGTKVTFRLSVAEEYRDKDTSDGYTVDTEKTLLASSAAENAASIVAAQEADNDLGKLTNYKNEICNLTDYNHDAVDNGASYGNPWQLIWVFDNNPDTKVVCEGYSKAFQYLCDLTNFNDSSIESHIVTGDMVGGTGAGAHMWNVVQMDDEKNYLVDVTNSDEETIGNPDKLFLKGHKGYTEPGTYTFKCNETNILFTYDADTLALYSEEELALSDNDYDEEEAQSFRDQHVANEVIALIDQIIDFGEITEETLEEAENMIGRARDAFDALSPEAQDLVTNYSQLEQAEDTLTAIQEEVEEVNNVVEMINALSDITSPEDVTEDVREQITAARDAYDALSDEQRERIDADTLEILENAEKQAEHAGTLSIGVDETKHVDIENEGDETIFCFAPEEDGVYIFTSTGDKDTYCSVEEITDNENNEITSDTCRGDGDNFLVAFTAKAGNTYLLHCSLFDESDTGSYDVSLTESPVKKISYKFGQKNILMENMKGETETDEEENEFFHYDLPYAEEGDVLTVTDTDENTTEYTYGYSESREDYYFISEDGDVINSELVSFDSDQNETHWTVGDRNNVTVSYLGVKNTTTIIIKANPVTGISFSHNGKAEMPLILNRDGVMEYDDEAEDDYYKYEPCFREGDTLTLEGEGGPCGTYTWLNSKDGFFLKGHPVIDEHSDDMGFRIVSDQSYGSPWTKVGGNYKFVLSYYGQSCDIAVKLIEHPITAIRYEGDPASMTENINANWIEPDPDDPDANGYYNYYPNTETFKNGSKLIVSGDKLVAGTYVYDKEEGSFICEELSAKIDQGDFEFTKDEQETTPWKFGATQNSIWTYQGVEIAIPVKLVENQVKSITFELADQTYCLFEQKDQKIYVGGAMEELWNTFGHKLTITKKDNTKEVYTFQEVDGEDLEYSSYFVSSDGTDMISMYDLNIWTDDEAWTAEKNAVLKASYMGAETSFTMPVRNPITRIEYVPDKDYVVYDGAGRYEDNEYCYLIDTERAGDVLNLYDSNEEGAAPTLVFKCERDKYGDIVWKTENGVKLGRIGEFYVSEEQPWDEDFQMMASLHINHNYEDEYEDEFYQFTDMIPVTLSGTAPIKAVSYQQVNNEVELYQGIDDGIGELGYSGYTAIAEGDTVTVTDSEDNEKVYTATRDEETGDLSFVNGSDALDWTYVDIQPVEADDAWTLGAHEFIFSYYGVESTAKMQVKISESPITDVSFTPAEPIVWDAEEAERDWKDKDGNPITIYRPYYDEAGRAVFHTGDTLTFKWKGTMVTYIYNAEDEYFRDDDDGIIQAPFNYEDDQENGELWDIGVNKGYISVGGVRSEAFDVTVKCGHRVKNHTDVVEATCTKAGQNEYWTCAYCGNMYSDQACTNLIDEPEVIPASHDWGAWAFENDEVHQRMCKVCHEMDRAAHNWDAGTETKAPTEDEPGIKTYTCSECDGTKQEEIPALQHEHNMEHMAAADATCMEEGNLEYWHCTECDQYFKDQAGSEAYAMNAWIVPKKKHTMKMTEAVEPTCTDEGNSAYWYCSKCEKYFSDAKGDTEITENTWIIPVDSSAHSWGEWTKLNDQQHQRVCGHDSNHVETADHSWDEGKITKEATEDETGLKTWTCTVCNATKTETIDKLPHTHVMQHTAAVEPTNIKNGNYEYWYCNKCKKYFKDGEGSQEYADKEWFREATGGSEAVAAAVEADTAIQNAAKVNANDYSEASYKALTDARVALQEVLDNPNATADEIKTATQNLQTAIDNLVTKEAQGRADAATTATTAIQNAAKVNKAAYSAASYKAVESAVKALQAVLDNPDATADEIKAATDKLDKAIKALKKNQPMKVKQKTIKVKLKKVRKKAQTVKPLTVTGQQGTVTYKGTGINKKAKKALKINAKTGKITVKKKTKKGTYKMKVTVTAAGNATYAAGSKTLTVTIRVK